MQQRKALLAALLLALPSAAPADAPATVAATAAAIAVTTEPGRPRENADVVARDWDGLVTLVVEYLDEVLDSERPREPGTPGN